MESQLIEIATLVAVPVSRRGHILIAGYASEIMTAHVLPFINFQPTITLHTSHLLKGQMFIGNIREI
jgi:hypothetical protein